jgi:hypothetical protein
MAGLSLLAFVHYWPGSLDAHVSAPASTLPLSYGSLQDYVLSHFPLLKSTTVYRHSMLFRGHDHVAFEVKLLHKAQHLGQANIRKLKTAHQTRTGQRADNDRDITMKRAW